MPVRACVSTHQHRRLLRCWALHRSAARRDAMRASWQAALQTPCGVRNAPGSEPVSSLRRTKHPVLVRPPGRAADAPIRRLDSRTGTGAPAVGRAGAAGWEEGATRAGVREAVARGTEVQEKGAGDLEERAEAVAVAAAGA